MKLRIFDIVKQLEDDFTYNIKESFEEAAVDAEQKAIEKQLKMEAAAQKKMQQNQNNRVSERPKVDPRGASIALNNIMGINHAKVQNIRQSSAIRPSFYPFQEGVAKKAPPPSAVRASNVPLEMVLLKNHMGN